MILQLANALDVPLRERNGLLLAAGYAPVFRESPLDAPELGAVRTALDAMLAKHEPYPAVVMNRSWDILIANAGATRFFGHLLGDAPRQPANVVRMIFDPAALRPYDLRSVGHVHPTTRRRGKAHSFRGWRNCHRRAAPVAKTF